MIVELLFTSILNVFYFVFDGVNIDSIPNNLVNEAHSTIQSMITNAENLIDLVLPYQYAKVLLVLTLSIEAFVGIYSLVMWVLRKIPVASIN